MPEPNSDLLNNRYQLLELIGKGAMGRVYRAKDTRLGAVVAVKFLAQTLLNRRMRDRFWTEASICAQLGQKSIHIVRVTDYDVNHEDVPYYVMEYLQGESLSDIIRRQPLPLPRFLSLIRQVILGLQAAHQGIDIDGTICPIIHRDIKPSNMLVTQDQSLGELVKVLDFGISKLLQEDSNQTSTYMGTMVYSSPEQMEGRELDVRSDIYSLGVMMFEMLTGKLPIHAETHSFAGWYRAHTSQSPRTLSAVAPGMVFPKTLETLVMSCLAKNPKDRPQTAIEILKVLEPLEERYEANRSLTDRINGALMRQSLLVGADGVDRRSTARGRGTTSVLDELYRVATWPQDKPIGAITFVRSLEIYQKQIPLVWAMLPYEEIKELKLHQLYNRIYKNVLCLPSPYPLAIWTTAIYNHACHQGRDPRWFSHFLDLRTAQGQEILHMLGAQGKYYVLIFAQEMPQKCALVLEMLINAQLQSRLQEWAILSPTWRPVGDPGLSKNILKNELDKVKVKVNQEFTNR